MSISEIPTEELQAEILRRQMQPSVEYALAIRYNPNLQANLHQNEVWQDRSGNIWLIPEMATSHIENLLGWLERRKLQLKLGADFGMTFGPLPSGEAACDAFESAHQELLEATADDWFDNLPLVRKLRAVLAEREENWLIKSSSGATSTCMKCGTIYDNHGVDIEDMIPRVGDGCNFCDPQEDHDD